jgi:hypothetical protein
MYSLGHVRIVIELDILTVLPTPHVLLAARSRVVRQVSVAVIAIVARHRLRETVAHYRNME